MAMPRTLLACSILASLARLGAGRLGVRPQSVQVADLAETWSAESELHNATGRVHRRSSRSSRSGRSSRSSHKGRNSSVHKIRQMPREAFWDGGVAWSSAVSVSSTLQRSSGISEVHHSHQKSVFHPAIAVSRGLHVWPEFFLEYFGLLQGESVVNKVQLMDGTELSHGARRGPTRVVEVPTPMYPLAGALLSFVVVFIYGPRGPRVVMGVLVYVGSLSTMTLSVKYVLSRQAYAFPSFVSSLHFLSGGIVTSIVLAVRQRQTGVPIPTPTVYEFWILIFPIAVAVVVSMWANNMALVLCSAAFTEIIGSSTCLITIGLVVFMGMPFDKRLILPVLLVALGCAFSIHGEVNFSSSGVTLCFLSNVFRSLRASLQQKLMFGETRNKFDPCSLLFWICWPSMVVMFMVSWTLEGSSPYQHLQRMERGPLCWLVFAIFVSCVNATVLNLSQLFVTKDLGAVGSQVAGQAKSVLTVMGAMVLFHEPVTALQIAGFMQVLAGVFMYSNMDQLRMKQHAAKALHYVRGPSKDLLKPHWEKDPDRASARAPLQAHLLPSWRSGFPANWRSRA